MKQDIRITKSKRDIEQAMILLILETGFGNLTVNKICQKAMVSRSTFYSHYQDKDDVLEAIITKTLSEITSISNPKNQPSFAPSELEKSLNQLYNYYMDNQSTLKALLLSQTQTSDSFEHRFIHKYETIIQESHQTMFSSKKQHIPPLLSHLYASTLFTLLKWIITHGHTPEVDYIASQLHKHFQSITKELNL